jgi:hypothetical protein
MIGKAKAKRPIEENSPKESMWREDTDMRGALIEIEENVQASWKC